MFVSDEWILSIADFISQSFYLLDIRRTISSELQVLASLCRISEVAVRDAMQILNSNQLFMPKMLSRNTLHTQVDIIVSEAIKDTIAEQNQSRQLIALINQENQLVSALGTNYLYQIYNYTTEVYYSVR